MKRIDIICKALMASAFLIFGSSAFADTEYVCEDTAGNSGSGGGNAGSSITDTGDSADVMTSDCGPYSGNNMNSDLNGLYGMDWTLLDDTDSSDGTNDGIITCDDGSGGCDGSTSGTFSFTDIGAAYYLIVFKFDNVYAAFKSNTAADDWLWDTDWDGDEKYDNSHLSVYGTGGDMKVTEPGTLGLLGLGLLGLGVARRRKE